jgi:hypothetical protein
VVTFSFMARKKVTEMKKRMTEKRGDLPARSLPAGLPSFRGRTRVSS